MAAMLIQTSEGSTTNSADSNRSTSQKVVLVTGGAGFIGAHTAHALLSRGDKVVIIDEMNEYYDVRLKQNNLDYLYETFGDRCQFYVGDICNEPFLKLVFAKEKPTHICHLAARAGVRPSIENPYIYVHSNVEGTTRLLDQARINNIQNFVYASSSSVYGNSVKELLHEDDAVGNPVSPYAATKRSCELLAYTFHHLYGLNCTGLRFFTVYGPRGRPDMAPFKFIDRVSKGATIQQFGDGTTSRDYTYISDIVDGVIRSIDRPLGYQVFNLGNGRPFGLSDFISLVETCVGKKAVIEVLPKQPGDVDRTCADINKARELLGYDPQVPFEEGIRKTVEWYKKAQGIGLFRPKQEVEAANRDWISYRESFDETLLSLAASQYGDSSVRSRTFTVTEPRSYGRSPRACADNDVAPSPGPSSVADANDISPYPYYQVHLPGHSAAASSSSSSSYDYGHHDHSHDHECLAEGGSLVDGGSTAGDGAHDQDDDSDDLELSSFVEKSTGALNVRRKRILTKWFKS